MFSTSLLDWALVAGYFAFLAAVWLRLFGARLSAVDYLVAGRRVTLPALVATLVATWYGGILGVGEYSYRYGVSNWLVFGVPYYAGALLFALLFARRARESALLTIPDLLHRTYGKPVAFAGALLVFITSAPAAYVLMLGTLFAAMVPVALAPCIVAAAVLSLFYIDRGGLRTVVFTDQVQFALMFAGFFMIVGFLVVQHGGLGFLQRSLPPTHFTWNGGNPVGAILVWYVIALSTLVDPGFWQRAYAARDPEVARKAVLWSIVCWTVFDFLTTTTGLYARAVLPHLRDPVFAFPELARVTLPPGALGLFYLAMIATVMSTIDSYGFIAATTLGRDVIWRLRGKPDESRIAFYSRIGLAISTVFATVLALARRSVIDLWHDLGSITTPALLLPVGVALLGRGRLPARWTIASMIVSFAVSLWGVLLRIMRPQGPRPFPWSLEPIYVGLGASFLIYAAGWLTRRRHAGATVAAMAIALALPSMGRAQGSTRADTTAATSDTLGHVVQLPEVVVSTTRPGERAPIARSTLDRKELQERNIGLDTPMLLSTLPSAYAYSDAGNGIGYSYLSIRGFPQRRISVLINGVPLNDPQSHEVYWIDHPDLLASSAEVQVQRGVGSALYGAASLGGSVNLEVPPYTDAPAVSARVAYGSYETKRGILEMNSGRLAGGWNVYGRYSRIESDGFRDQSWSKLWSYTLGARHVGEHQTWRINLYGGPEQTHLAYLGVSPDYLNGTVTGDREHDRRFNPLTYKNERDHFFEPHYELIHGWSPRKGLSLSQTLFWFDGKGYYDEQRFDALASYRLTPWPADTSLYPPEVFRDDAGNVVRDSTGRPLLVRTNVVRRRTVSNRNYGWLPRLRIEHAGGALTVGGELRGADGRHWGELLTGDGLPPGTQPDHLYYDYHPRTFAAGVFAREEWQLQPRLLATADLAWRHQDYRMRDDHFDGIQFDQSYDFGLPRLGLTWTPTPSVEAFVAWARSSREPAFRDLYDGEAVGNLPLYGTVDVAAGIYENPLIHPERVDDFELNGTWRGRQASATATLFRMNFRDELVYAGQFNTDLGYPILGNAARSVHQGIELAARVEGAVAARHRLSLTGNLTLSDHHFLEYQEVYGTAPGDTFHYDGNTIGFFPQVLANLGGRWSWRAISLGADAQHVGRIYLDNTEQRAASIAPRTVLDLTGGVRVGVGGAPIEILAHVFNVFDQRYETGGYMDYDASGALVSFRTPAAGRNVLVELRTDFK